MQSIRAHPAYPQLLEAYRKARDVWSSYSETPALAAAMGLSQREYCDRVVAGICPYLTWSSSTNTDDEITQAHYDQAYLDAGG